MVSPTSVSVLAVISSPHMFDQITDTFPEFAQGKVDPHEAGKQGGHSSGGSGSSESTGSDNSGGSVKGRK